MKLDILTLRLFIGEQCKAFRTKAIAQKARLINIESFCEGQTWQMVVQRLEDEPTVIGDGKRVKRLQSRI